MTDADVVHLRGGGVSLVLGTPPDDGRRLPVVLHWGADLGGSADPAALLAATTAAVPYSAPDVPVHRRVRAAAGGRLAAAPGPLRCPGGRQRVLAGVRRRRAHRGPVRRPVRRRRDGGAHGVRRRRRAPARPPLAAAPGRRPGAPAGADEHRAVAVPPRLAGRDPAAAPGRHRGPRPHRPLGVRAGAAAAAPRGRHLAAGVAARPHRARRADRPLRRHARVRLPVRRGVGRAPGVERRPARYVAERCPSGQAQARRRRAAARRAR